MRKPVSHRDHAGEPAPGAVAVAPSLSFARDIRPMFEPFAAAMMWRFDLTDYAAVKANASTILGRISSPDNAMPPPPYPMLTVEQINRFQNWMTQGFHP